MYDNAKEMAEDLAIETQRANDWEAKYTELLAEHVQLLGKYGKIVECKDCKYFSQNDRWCERYECGEGCGSICWDLGEDGFCSKAEERIYCKDCKYFKVGKCYWRGDFEEAEKMNGVKIIREYPQPTNMNDWCGNGEKR